MLRGVSGWYKVIASDIKHRNLERAEALRAVISRISPSEMSGSRMESSVELLSEYLGCLIAAREERTDAAARAKSLANRAVNMQSIELPSFPNDFIRLVRHNMTVIAARGRKAPIKREHAKVGRNKVVTVEYEDGLRSGKYKTFQDDLDKGICKLALASA